MTRSHAKGQVEAMIRAVKHGVHRILDSRHQSSSIAMNIHSINLPKNKSTMLAAVVISHEHTQFNQLLCHVMKLNTGRILPTSVLHLRLVQRHSRYYLYGHPHDRVSLSEGENKNLLSSQSPKLTPVDILSVSRLTLCTGLRISERFLRACLRALSNVILNG